MILRVGFRLAVNYLFMTNDGDGETRELVVEPFDAVVEQNDYEVLPFPSSPSPVFCTCVNPKFVCVFVCVLDPMVSPRPNSQRQSRALLLSRIYFAEGCVRRLASQDYDPP